MIEIDGSIGEGGGQVLRSALALSILTGLSVHIRNIRIKRSKPGLMPQHLASVDAAAAISKAEVEGAQLSSTEITFKPNKLRGGRFTFNIGTAGSTSLLLQTIFLPLSFSNSTSSVTITGGTHVPWSPCFHYLEFQWLPLLRRMGFDVHISLDQVGFYPQGGGRINATIHPVHQLCPLQLESRGKIIRISGISAVANLKDEIAERQKRHALYKLNKLGWEGNNPEIKIKTTRLKSRYKGTLFLILAEFENGCCCYYRLGELGKSAEKVANEAIDDFLEFLASDGAVDQYISDQILLPLAFSKEPSQFRTSKLSLHLLTNIEILCSFLSCKVMVEGEIGKPTSITILPSNE